MSDKIDFLRGSMVGVKTLGTKTGGTKFGEMKIKVKRDECISFER